MERADFGNGGNTSKHDHTYTWEQLGLEVGLECSGHTVQRVMRIMYYRNYIASTEVDRIEVLVQTPVAALFFGLLWKCGKLVASSL